MKYVLFGANGAAGQAVAAELAAREQPFRAVARSAATLEARFGRYGSLAERITADVADLEDARRAARGAETIFYLVGVPYDRFALHPAMMRVTLDAGAAEGCKRLVHLSNVYPYGLPRTELVDESHPREPHTFKGRMRKEQEDLVLDAHARGVLQTTILRAPDFYGPAAEQSLAYQIFNAAVAGKRANVIGPIDAPHEFAYMPDLGRALVELSLTEGAYGNAWNIAGPDRITVREFARRVYARSGSEPKLFVINKTMLRLFGLFDPTLRELVEMHYLQSDPVNLDDRRLRALLPNLRKTPYDDGIAQTIDALRAQTVVRTASAATP